jgi:hypothetical protein
VRTWNAMRCSFSVEARQIGFGDIELDFRHWWFQSRRSLVVERRPNGVCGVRTVRRLAATGLVLPSYRPILSIKWNKEEEEKGV